MIGIFDKLEERVVGKSGIIVEPHPKLKNGKIAKKLAADIRQKWGMVYSTGSDPSVYPPHAGAPDVTQLVARRGGFAQIVSGTGNGLTPTAGVPFWLEALEADFVPQTSNESDKLNQGYIPITGAGQRAIWFIKACRSLAGNWKRNGLMRKTCST